MSRPFSVVLIPPSTSLVNAWKNTHVPVGLTLLAAILRRLPGVRVRLWSGPLYFPDAAHARAAAQAVLADGTALVGVSAWCHTLPAQLTLAEAIRAEAPAVPIVFGGPQATATDAALLAESPAIDWVLRGEAEHSLPELVRRLQAEISVEGVAGLTRRGPEGPVRTPPPPPCLDLDALPEPAHDLLPPSPVATVESGRGCPWACRFCSTSAFFARKHRARGAESLVDELHRLAARGVRHVTFTDDIFTVNKRQVRALCAELRARPPGLAWGCSTRIDCVEAPLLAEMAAVGCDSILFGVETGSPRLQRLMGKRLDVTKVEPVMALTRAAGIRPYCTFIFGFPEATPADLAATTRLVRRLAAQGVHVTAQTLAVLPDTPYDRDLRDALRWDGHTSLSRATLTAAEAARARANPALFSSFHYLPSGAGARRHLIACAGLTNVLRHFAQTARVADFAERRDPFRALRHTPDPVAAIGHTAAEAGAWAEAWWALESAALVQRMTAPPAGVQWHGVLPWRAPVDLETGAGPGRGYLVHLEGEHGLRLSPLPLAVAEALLALPLGGSLASARAALVARLGPAGRRWMADLAAAGALRTCARSPESGGSSSG